ncbi:hypothetical protein Esti_004696 [Eimeria stiedai]
MRHDVGSVLQCTEGEQSLEQQQGKQHAREQPVEAPLHALDSSTSSNRQIRDRTGSSSSSNGARSSSSSSSAAAALHADLLDASAPHSDTHQAHEQQQLKGHHSAEQQQQQQQEFSGFVPWPGRAEAARTGTAQAAAPRPPRRELEALQQGLAAAAATSSSSSHATESSVGRAVRRQASKLKRLTAGLLSRSLSSSALGAPALFGGASTGNPGRDDPRGGCLDSRVLVGEEALLSELPLEAEEPPRPLQPFVAWSRSLEGLGRSSGGEGEVFTLLNHSSPLKTALPASSPGSSPASTAAAAAAAAAEADRGAGLRVRLQQGDCCPYVPTFEQIIRQLGPLLPRRTAAAADPREAEAAAAAAATAAAAASAAVVGDALARPSSKEAETTAADEPPASEPEWSTGPEAGDHDEAVGEPADASATAASDAAADGGDEGESASAHVEEKLPEATDAAAAEAATRAADEAAEAAAAEVASEPYLEGTAGGAKDDSPLPLSASAHDDLGADPQAAETGPAQEPAAAAAEAATAEPAAGLGGSEEQESVAAKAAGEEEASAEAAGYAADAEAAADTAAAAAETEAAGAAAAAAAVGDSGALPLVGTEEMAKAFEVPRIDILNANAAAADGAADAAAAAADAAADAAAVDAAAAGSRGDTLGAISDRTPRDVSGSEAEAHEGHLTASSRRQTSRGSEEDVETLEARQLRMGLSDFPEWLMQVNADADEERQNPYKAIRLRNWLSLLESHWVNGVSEWEEPLPAAPRVLRRTGLRAYQEEASADAAAARRIQSRLEWMHAHAAGRLKPSSRLTSTEASLATPAGTAESLSGGSSRSSSTLHEPAWRRRRHKDHQQQRQEQQERSVGGGNAARAAALRRDLRVLSSTQAGEAEDGELDLPSAATGSTSVSALRARFERRRSDWFQDELSRFSRRSVEGNDSGGGG